MQNQNWTQVSQNPQPVYQVQTEQGSFFLTRCCVVLAMLAGLFGFQLLIPGFVLSFTIGTSFIILLLIGSILVGSSIFCCVRRSQENKQALLRSTTAYTMTQAQVPQYPVATVPGYTATSGTLPPPASYPAPSYSKAASPMSAPPPGSYPAPAPGSYPAPPPGSYPAPPPASYPAPPPGSYPAPPPGSYPAPPPGSYPAPPPGSYPTPPPGSYSAPSYSDVASAPKPAPYSDVAPPPNPAPYSDAPSYPSATPYSAPNYSASSPNQPPEYSDVKPDPTQK